MKYVVLALTALLLVGIGSAANAQGLWPGLPAASAPLTGSETIPADTNLSGGRSPQTEIISSQLLSALRPTSVNNTTTATVSTNLKTTTLVKLTLGANGGLACPTLGIDGQVWSVLATQDATGGRTLGYDDRCFKWTAGTKPTVTATAGRTTRLDFIYNATTGFNYGVVTLNYF